MIQAWFVARFQLKWVMKISKYLRKSWNKSSKRVQKQRQYLKGLKTDEKPQKTGSLNHRIIWHFIGKVPIWSKWRYVHGRVVWAISKHLRPNPSPTVENSLRNRHLNQKNKKSKNFKMLRNNIFSPEKSHFLIMYGNQWLWHNLQLFCK